MSYAIFKIHLLSETPSKPALKKLSRHYNLCTEAVATAANGAAGGCVD